MTRHDGPESRDGWRAEVDVDGTKVTVEARHSTRRRLARSASEISRNAARGRHPMSQVEDRTLEWAVSAKGRHVATLRLEPSGTVTSGNRRYPRMGIEDAAAAAYRALAGRTAAPG